MRDRITPVSAQVRSNVDRILMTLADVAHDADDFDWHIRRLAESCYASGYEDGHSAGSSETFSREYRKRERQRDEQDGPDR